MGGIAGYARPVQPTDGRMSSWINHTNRYIPSTEPGTDYYCPIGTPIRVAASGRVVDVGTSIQPATGRYITVDLDDGRRVRYLHILRHRRNVGDRVQWGEHIADSGATGYGEADWSWNVAGTGGAHVHMTLFRNHSYTFGRYATLDPELYMAANQSGSNAVPITPVVEEEEVDDMAIENVMHHKINADKRMEVKVSNPFSGFELNFVTGSKDTLQAFADQYKTGNSQKVSSSVFRVIGEAQAAVRPQGTIAVNLGDADA